MSAGTNATVRSPLVTHAIGAGVCAAGLALWYVGLVAPVIESSVEARLGRARVRDLDATLAEAAAARDELAVQVSRQSAELAANARVLRPVSALNARIADVAGLASENGVSISALEPGAASDSPFAVKVPISIKGRSESAAAVRFLASLHTRFPDIAVAAFVVAGPSGEGSESSVHVELIWYAERAASQTTAAAPSP